MIQVGTKPCIRLLYFYCTVLTGGFTRLELPLRQRGLDFAQRRHLDGAAAGGRRATLQGAWKGMSCVVGMDIRLN